MIPFPNPSIYSAPNSIYLHAIKLEKGDISKAVESVRISSIWTCIIFIFATLFSGGFTLYVHAILGDISRLSLSYNSFYITISNLIYIFELSFILVTIYLFSRKLRDLLKVRNDELINQILKESKFPISLYDFYQKINPVYGITWTNFFFFIGTFLAIMLSTIALTFFRIS